MQVTENEQKEKQAPPDPQSQPFVNSPLAKEADEDDPKIIFAKAVAEIDTQPLLQGKKRRHYRIFSFLQDAFCLLMILLSVVGIIWQCITYPHMVVVLVTMARPAEITTTLDVPTRTLAPVTITRSATSATTGTGHQDAQGATGYVTFYNGLSTGQTVRAETVLTGKDGMQIEITQEAVIPAADTTTTPPADGYVTVSAQAVQSGRKGNIDLDGKR